jgi:hypothetical protein
MPNTCALQRLVESQGFLGEFLLAMMVQTCLLAWQNVQKCNSGVQGNCFGLECCR